MLLPGSAVDLSKDVTIKGVPVSKLSGKYMLVTVNLIHPTALRAAMAKLTHDGSLIDPADLLPAGVTEQEYLKIQDKVFQSSQVAAAAAAARSNGMEVTLSGRGALITDILEGSPASKALEVGDVITSINGKGIKLVTDMTEETTTAPEGTKFEVIVRRKGREVTRTIRSARLSNFNAAGKGIGVLTATADLKADLPFDIKFKKRNIGGPSAGLAYALTINDLIDAADVAKGRVIAATGAIEPEGAVGAVGGVEQKTEVARKAGVDIFMVPDGEVGRTGTHRTIEGVDDLAGALEILKSS